MDKRILEVGLLHCLVSPRREDSVFIWDFFDIQPNHFNCDSTLVVPPRPSSWLREGQGDLLRQMQWRMTLCQMPRCSPSSPPPQLVPVAAWDSLYQPHLTGSQKDHLNCSPTALPGPQPLSHGEAAHSILHLIWHSFAPSTRGFTTGVCAFPLHLPIATSRYSCPVPHPDPQAERTHQPSMK